MGVGNVNKRMSRKSEDGQPNWKRALFGESGEAAHKAQMMTGRKIKQADEARKSMKKRKIRKVTV